MNSDLLWFVDVLALGRLSDLGKIKVIVIGDAMLDCDLNGVAKPLSAEASVPVVTVNHRQQTLGGAANIAVNLHNLGGCVTFLSVIGDDWEGALLRRSLESQGISTKYVLTQTGRQTHTQQQVIAASQLLVRFEQGSTDAIDSKTEQRLIEQLNSCFADCDAVVVSNYGDGVLTARVMQEIANLQSTQPRVLIIDSNHPTAYNQDVTAVKYNYDHAIKLVGVQAVALSDTRAKQLSTCQEQLLALTRAQITVVSLDDEEAIAFERVPNSSSDRRLSKIVNQFRVTTAGSTLLCALTLALATKAAQEPAEEQRGKIQPGNQTEEFSLFSDHSPLVFTEKYLTEHSQLITRVDSYRAAGHRIVFTNGCFDILHAGHVSYLNRARALGDILIIGVNSDLSVSRLKGPTRPINPLLDRIQVLAALSCVDHLVAFEEDSPINLIQLVRPDVYVKGGDYTKATLPEASLVEQLGGVIEILSFVENRSTTRIVERIHQAQLAKDEHKT